MNNTFQKNRIFSAAAAGITLIIAFLICFSMAFPTNLGKVYQSVGKPSATLGVEDANDFYDCTLSPSGEYEAGETDPQMIFETAGYKTKAVKLNAAYPAERSVGFTVYTADESGEYYSQRYFEGCIFKGEKSAVVDIPDVECPRMRVDIDNSFHFESFEIYGENPILVKYTAKPAASSYVFVVAVPLLFAAAVWFINEKTEFARKLIFSIRKKKKKILSFLVFSAAAVLLSLLAETLLMKSGGFNVCRLTFLFGSAELLVIFLFGLQDLKKKPEKVFLGIALVVGTVMLFGSPIMHICWDFDSHYPWAVDSSYFGTSYFTAADSQIVKLGVFGSGFDLQTYKEYLNEFNKADGILISKSAAQFSISHLPAGIFLALGRLLGLGFTARYNLGRVAYILVYSFVCYFAIKKIKSGKMILSVICLLPTVLFMATNYSYDYWVISFSVLGTAYYVNILQNPEKQITVADTVIMCCAFALASLPKLVYIVMLLMPLFVFKKWNVKEKKRYYLIILTIFAVVFMVFIAASLTQISGAGDIRGGAVNPKAQLVGIITAPVWYAKLLIKFLFKYLSIGMMKEYITFFGYMGTGKLYPVFIILIMFTALTDSSPDADFKIPVFIRVCSVVLLVGLSALIATALYISFTPLGNSTVLGCQQRYIVPLLAPFITLVTGRRINLIKNKTLYNGVVLGTASVTAMIETYAIIVSRMI